MENWRFSRSGRKMWTKKKFRKRIIATDGLNSSEICCIMKIFIFFSLIFFRLRFICFFNCSNWNKFVFGPLLCSNLVELLAKGATSRKNDES